MQITQDAKDHLKTLRKYLPNPETMTYEIVVNNEAVQIIPTHNKKFADYICDESWVIAGIGPEADVKLRGRTIMLDPSKNSPKLILEERRRVPRLACA